MEVASSLQSLHSKCLLLDLNLLLTVSFMPLSYLCSHPHLFACTRTFHSFGSLLICLLFVCLFVFKETRTVPICLWIRAILPTFSHLPSPCLLAHRWSVHLLLLVHHSHIFKKTLFFFFLLKRCEGIKAVFLQIYIYTHTVTCIVIAMI